MKYALYLGCAVPVKALKYEISARTLAGTLGIEFVDLPEFSCCGFPVKSMDPFAALVMAARNLAIAGEKGMNIVTLCTGCSAILNEAETYLADEHVRAEVNGQLRKMGMKGYAGGVTVRHFARVLWEEVGPDRLKEGISHPLTRERLAVHYGCHYMKPTHAHGHFDDPSHPVTIDGLLRVTGAETIDYMTKGQCCGLTVMGTDEDLGHRLALEKIEAVTRSGASALIVACPSCCIAYENNQGLLGRKSGKSFRLPVLYYTQILALGAGLTEKDAGFEFNRIAFRLQPGG